MGKKIGFIGLGVMGKPMAKNLLKAGYELTVYDVTNTVVKEIVAAGAKRGESSKDVAAKSDVVITMLPNSSHVKEVVCGLNGVLDGAKPGLILIDMSSISPLVTKEIAKTCARKGVKMLDAPVSGGEPKAIDGSLSIMVGSEAELFDKVRGILGKMGSSVTLCGGVSAGNTAKLANQVVVAVNIAALSEALVLGKKAGVEPEVIFQAIRGGLAGSTVMDSKAPMMLSGSFNPGFRIELHIKDLRNVIDTGHSIGVPLPLTSSVMEMMQWLKANNKQKLDHSALVQYYESLAGIDVRE